MLLMAKSLDGIVPNQSSFDGASMHIIYQLTISPFCHFAHTETYLNM